MLYLKGISLKCLIPTSWGLVGSPYSFHFDFDEPWCFLTKEMALFHSLYYHHPHLPFGQHMRISLVPCRDCFGDSGTVSTHKEDGTLLFCPLSLALIPNTWCSVPVPLPKLLRPHRPALFMTGQQEGSGLGSEAWEVGLCSGVAQEWMGSDKVK